MKDTLTWFERKRANPWAWLSAAAVAGASLLLYLPSLVHAFINWDDGSVVDQARRLLPVGPESLKWMFTSFALSTWQPLPWLVYTALYAAGGQSPAPYHAVSWALHGAACACYVSCAYALLTPSLGERLGNRKTAALAAFAGLLFAWHPLQVESVAAAASIADMMAVTFALAAAAAYLHSDRRPWLYRASLMLFALACMSRWQAFALPVALSAADFARGRRVLSRRALPYYLGAAALAAVYWSVKAEQHGYHSVGARPREAAVGLLLYAGKWLRPAELLPVYMLDELAAGRAGTAALPAAAGLVVLCGALARRLPGLAAAAALYLAAVAPTLLLTGEGHVFGHDRYAYLACAGFPILAAWLAGRAWASGRGAAKLAAAALAALLIAGLGSAARAQLDVWSGPREFWDHALSIRPEWPLALDRLGEFALSMARYDEALDLFRRSGRRDPAAARLNSAFAYLNWGVDLTRMGKLDQAAAAFRKAGELNPALPEASDYLERVERARRGLTKASRKRRSGSARRRGAKAS